MTQLVVAAAVAAVAVGVGLWLRRRQRAAAPSPVGWTAPTVLDRADFPDAAGRPWLVVVFSSGTCDSCAAVVRKAEVLASTEVAVVEAEFGAARHLHERYGIDAVPIVCLADAQGVVQASFVGPMTATDLWAAVAEARDPGCRPTAGCHPDDP
jgi:hypothetical protein